MRYKNRGPLYIFSSDFHAFEYYAEVANDIVFGFEIQFNILKRSEFAVVHWNACSQHILGLFWATKQIIQFLKPRYADML